ERHERPRTDDRVDHSRPDTGQGDQDGVPPDHAAFTWAHDRQIARRSHCPCRAGWAVSRSIRTLSIFQRVSPSPDGVVDGHESALDELRVWTRRGFVNWLLRTDCTPRSTTTTPTTPSRRRRNSN